MAVGLASQVFPPATGEVGVLDAEAVFLAKPFSLGALTRAVREAIQGGATQA